MSLLQQKILELKGVKARGVKDISHAQSKDYDDIFRSSLDYVEGLKEYHQEIITVILPNSIEYLEVLIACILTGNIFNPIPFFTSDQELVRIFKYIDSKVVITTRKLINKKYDSQEIYSPESFRVVKNNTLYTKTPVNGNKIAALYYSSGTTGNPKGVLYSHDNIFYLIESINKGFGFDGSTKHLSILPFGHTASINYNIFPCLFNKSNLVIAEGFSSVAHRFFKILSEEEINYTQLVPTIVYMLLKVRYDTSEMSFNSLEFIGCGSSILPVESQIRFERQYGIRIGNLYGLSETGPSHIDDPRLLDWKPRSIGIPLDVNICKLSKNSELLIKGRNIFSGYYKNIELYNKVVKDGWFYTGDLVSCYKGQYTYKDRKKDLIIKSGINIVPGEVEEILYMNKYIHEAAVVGVPHEVHGEEIIAIVTLKDSYDNKDEVKTQLYQLLTKFLSSYKHPIDILFFESLPKTHSGKIMRRELRRVVKHEYN